MLTDTPRFSVYSVCLLQFCPWCTSTGTTYLYIASKETKARENHGEMPQISIEGIPMADHVATSQS